ncbi:hypothetical protein ABB37_06336 [Leptomonas pyrrhocoris]|uniref:Uncharacterized protein n=1 Tax=Leptomonas pyrrhocoris TaxID=157538 RepID=A0A0M9FXT3_LEPPY|nr:hypothetical protein ABB37_06336 [Leptomonas pyrrhocoris]KPA78163.1 hypothetical protein ABB37_06336 [Leptomonas pyrrhocoris]|eukprot:XP_015656602.1 hypothetical protein ABB37_06336 [Leptomonas pyrrhocoris]
MKAVLQVGPAQFIVDGATFHLLCEDITQTLKALLTLNESDVSLTLHLDALERCLADDAQRLVEAGVPLPRRLPHEGDDVDLSVDAGAPPPSPPPRRLSVSRGVREPINVFSSDSFDAAEALLQELQARLLEQRLLLEKCITAGTVAPNVERHESSVRDSSGEVVKDGVRSGTTALPRRVVPLPLLRIDTYLSSSVDVLPDYDAQGHRRRSSLTVLGTSSLPL